MKTLKILASLAIALIALTSFAMSASAQGPAAPAIPATTLDYPTTLALETALKDEYHAYAFYSAVIAKFGPVAPFTNILNSEASHIQALQTLMTRYGVPIPANPYTGNIQAPATLTEALQAGVDAEIANVGVYDTLSFVEQPDIRAVFEQLSAASQTKHLPAFQNALAGNLTGQSAPSFGRPWSR